MKLRNPLEKYQAAAAELREEDAPVLAAARQKRNQETDEFAVIKADQLKDHAAVNGTIHREAARLAGREAVEHVTGEHQIVPRMPEEPAVQVPVSVAPHEIPHA
ncbi:MAG TPA: hypothetical protein VF401_00090 [Candidatus Saccharimonadales bacterium]